MDNVTSARATAVAEQPSGVQGGATGVGAWRG
jgi:hypothetical protein